MPKGRKKGPLSVKAIIKKSHIKSRFRLRREKLTDKEIDFIVDRHIMGFSQRDIARALSIAQSTVFKYLHPEKLKELAIQRAEVHRDWARRNKDCYKKQRERKIMLYKIGGLEEINAV